MWSASEEPPGTMEGETSESVDQAKEKCEQNKNQLESLKEIMLKNKQSLKKKEEEAQEYARRLSKIKSRAKLSRRNKEGNLPDKDVTHTSEIIVTDTSEEIIDDISQAKTAKAKSTLLQKKLAENRKAFEQRNKEIIETKRAVEEKVEAIRQQLEEKDAAMSVQRDQLPLTSAKSAMITSDVVTPLQSEDIQEKENKIIALSNKILELQATIVDLEDNLKEKDSVIESKTKAVTLLSADLSKKGKTTLDTLEDTKDEMRTMQEHFILLETSLKSKNESLLTQLQGRDTKIAELEDTINRYQKQFDEQKLAESASADFSRSTMDTLVETKEAMKSMQENFVLIESSLKAKNENLLEQLKNYELKLAEANERVFKLESGIGIERNPTVEDLQYKLEKLEHSNKLLQDDKYELQKSVAELQAKIVNISMHGNGAVIEKDNRIIELENLIEELKQSNILLEEESKAELQKQVADLTLKNEEYSNKITDLENLVHELEEHKNDVTTRLMEESIGKDNENVEKLTKELETLNKSMIKMKAQHKSKVKSLQKQLENFKKMSDTNAELVRLGNQVALLEEEKGNLQLSLVDFDELKASAGDWQERVVDLENKVSAQTKEIEMQIEAIATLENQKLDLMQELHITKQEISSLEAENAESENLRVTAEMKVVDLEEQLEAMHRLQSESKLESSSQANNTELIKQVDALTQENAELYNRISKLEEKGTSDAGSTESFEAIQELDKTDLLKKIEDLTQKNNELTVKLKERENLNLESAETIDDTDKNELLKKIDQLTQENTELTIKLSRVEEKGSSDAGSTESFERIPEHNESMTKIELLKQENSELVIKLTKLEELLKHIESKSDVDLQLKVNTLLEENNRLQKQVEALSADNTDLAAMSNRQADQSSPSNEETFETFKRSKREVDFKAQVNVLMEEKNLLEEKIKELHNSLKQSHGTDQALQINDLRKRIEELLKENEEVVTKVTEFKTFNQQLKNNVTELTEMLHDDPNKLVEKLEKLNQEKQERHEQINTSLQKSNQEISEALQSDEPSVYERESVIVASLEREIEESKKLIVEQTGMIEEMWIKLAKKEKELEEKSKQIVEYEVSGRKVESLETELKDMFDTVEEWRYKCNEMQDNMEKLEAGKASIEERFRMLQNENEMLLGKNKEKDAEVVTLKQQLQNTEHTLEKKLQEQLIVISEKENEIANLKELQAKYMELQNRMILIDSLQDEVNNCKMLIQEKDTILASMSNEVANLNNVVRSKEEAIYILREDVTKLNEKVEESKPLKDYNDLLEQLKDKNMLLDEFQYKINATTKENNNLSEKVKNLTQQNNDLQNQLSEKQKELEDVVVTKDHLEANVKNYKTKAKMQVRDLKSIVDSNNESIENLHAELKRSHDEIQQLEQKHAEDTKVYHQEIEDLINKLKDKKEECNILTDELDEKENAKVALETKVNELEQKLAESKDKRKLQLEKMKKIAANLVKKSATCRELETTVAELKEKWTTEKDEKEAKCKEVEDVEITIREKDNRITDLEEKLTQVRNELLETSKNLEISKEKMSLLTQQITEMEEEITKLRTDVESLTVELESEKESKQNIESQFESYVQRIARENEREQLELEQTKEKARELSVRMQVMETEYVEQLALIRNLQAENGLLFSKQTQINEKLENVEKESEERRVLLEKFQKVTIDNSTMIEEDMELIQNCSQCEQYQILVQTLEGKLQEREAEIKDLENQLANLIDTTSESTKSTTLQPETLTSDYEEVKIKLEDATKEKDELLEKIEALQLANATLEEKVVATEQTLNENKMNIERLQSVDQLNSDLTRKCEEREVELWRMQQEMKVIQERAEKLELQLNAQMDSLQYVETQRAETERLLQDTEANLKKEIESLKIDKKESERMVEDLRVQLETEKNQSTKSVEESMKVSREAPVLETLPQDNVPQLFDAFKIFDIPPASDSALLTDKDARQLQTLLDAKEAQCSNLTQEINHLQKLMIEERAQLSQNYSQRVEELEMTQMQLQAVQANLERLEQVSFEKDKQIDWLNMELQNLSAKIIEQQNETDNKLKDSLLPKDKQLEELNKSLSAMKATLDETIGERDQQNVLLETYKSEISNLQMELRNLTDSELIPDLQKRVSTLTQERDLLQLQVNDLSRSMEQLKNSIHIEQNLQIEMEKAVRERDEARELVANLTKTLEDTRKQSDDKSTITDMSTKQLSTPSEEVTIVSSQVESDAAKVTTEEVQEEVSLDVGTMWDADSTEKLSVDEETWGWNADDAQLASEQQISSTLVPNTEMQLRVKVDYLQDQIKDMEEEKKKILDESMAIQTKNSKMIKKLKEYKVQVENLQQQLKIQKSASHFYELDSAIEEELKSQINKLEKTLNEVRDDQKSTLAEKEALMKRLDVVVSANERYMEMKEKQDMEMEVLRIRNKELSDKVETLDKRLQGSVAVSERNDIPQNETDFPSEEVKPVGEERFRKRSVEGEDYEAACKKYKDEIDDIKDEMEALATENEQLQHFLEEQKIKLSALESKRNAEENESIEIVDDLNKKISELQGMLSKSREEYDLLRKSYEQSLMDANDQVTAMRQNTDYLKEEAHEKTMKLETEIINMRKQLHEADSSIVELQKSLQDVLQEKTGLEERLTTVTASYENQLSSVNSSMSEVTALLNIRIQEVADLKRKYEKEYVRNTEVNMKLQDTIQELNQELNEKKQQVETLKKSLNDKENEVVQQKCVETVSALVSEATQELVQKHVLEIEDKEKEIRLLNERISMLEVATNECSLEKQNIAAQFDTQRQELELLKQNLLEKESSLESVQATLSSIKEQLIGRESELAKSEESVQKLLLENQKCMETIEELQRRLNEFMTTSAIDVNEYTVRIQGLEQQIQHLETSLKETSERYAQETAEYKTIIENDKIEIGELCAEIEKFDSVKNKLSEQTEEINSLNSDLEATRQALEEAKRSFDEKFSSLNKDNQALSEKQVEFDKLSNVQQEHTQQSSLNIVDGLPLFRMNDENQTLQHTIDTMQAELEKKQLEIDHLKYVLSENTYPNMILEMQERINCLYNEKAELQSSLDTLNSTVEEKEKQIDTLKQQIEARNQEFSKDVNLLSRDRRSVQDQEQIVRLQNELHAKEQEISELKYIIVEKDSQLFFYTNVEPQSDDFELREMVQRLTTELRGKEQEVHNLKSMINDLQKEMSRLQEFERLSEETRDVIQKLSAEKEQIRLEAQEFLEEKLKEKEMEIDDIKQRLAMENRNILGELELRDKDIENIKRQLQQSSMIEETTRNEYRQKDEELTRIRSEVAENERRLAELSITKDTELHNLMVQIRERDARIEELSVLVNEEEKQLTELRNTLESREVEINSLKALLEDKVKEHELIQNVLKKDVSVIDTSVAERLEASDEDVKTTSSQELDLALYMLHQRDVRCEELTLELMQLLEERDTLQLRLSNAIRVNEELRKVGGSASLDHTPKNEASTSATEEPIVEHPSPSKSQGPVEIAKEAIDAPVGEHMDTLAQKLTQLHTVSHAKDVRLRDERELRHTQQMSLLAHKDVLSTLPPEAATRLANANYTLSRDVQSHSSALMNWLWGKSTPKVVHM